MSLKLSSWLPATVAVVVVAGAVGIPAVANADASLATKTPAQVLALIGNSKVDAFSGTVKTSSSLGLPSLPSTGAGSSSTAGSASDILSLLSTPQTARVFVDGASKDRVQVLSTLAEQDVIHNGTDVWQYDSKKNTVTHVTLPAAQKKTTAEAHTPADVAKTIIAKLSDSTNFSVGTSAHVAGRTTYTLVLTPKATDTLVKSVSISVDSATGLPLAVEADARGQKDPAAEISFSKIDLSTPAASTFDFTAPKGAKVTEEKAPAKADHTQKPTAPSDAAKPTITGTGWDAVVATAASGAGDTSALTSSKLFTELTTAVTGGRLFHTSLVNILITDDGRIIAGSVPVAKLQAAAALK